MSRWYLVRTKPSAESRAERHLERQGYRVYVPRLEQCVRRVSGARRVKLVPLFPRYLFLFLHDGEQALSPVRSTVGVSSIVRFGLDYACVPERVIRDLFARADPQSGLHRLAALPPLVPGAPVRVALGPFDGLQGIFEREAGAERVVVLLHLLGHDASVCVDVEAVESIPGSAGVQPTHTDKRIAATSV